jgi:hypothetical protein
MLAKCCVRKIPVATVLLHVQDTEKVFEMPLNWQLEKDRKEIKRKSI